MGVAGAGRLEIFKGDSWGSVCNSDWSDQDSSVVCRELGHPGGLTADYRSFGKGGGDIKIARVSCQGNEARLNNCPSSSNVSGCGHVNDVAVICTGESYMYMYLISCLKISKIFITKFSFLGTDLCTDYSLRLVGGANNLIGRLEICYNGHWGTVCGDGTGSSTTANVSCKQLGYLGGTVLSHNKFYEKRVGVIWLGGVSCQGNESRLIDCAHSAIGSLTQDCSGHFQDMMIQCQGKRERVCVVDTKLH